MHMHIVIRHIWQETIMVMRLYPTSPPEVNAEVHRWNTTFVQLRLAELEDVSRGKWQK
jgi:hypothetical protein